MVFVLRNAVYSWVKNPIYVSLFEGSRDPYEWYVWWNRRIREVGIKEFLT